jgi:cytochrome c-type biogenesis protein
MDPLAAVASAVAHGSPAAIGSIFLAGVVSSIGPCVAPRYLAITGFASGSGRPTRVAAAFVGGLIGAYMVIGYTAGWLGSMRGLASIVDAGMACTLAVTGAIMIWRAETDAHAHCSPTAHDVPLGAPLLLGAASALVVSPCCTPMLAAIVATASELGRPLAGAAILACFAAGHAVPLFLAGSPLKLIARLRPSGIAAQVPAIVGGALLLCLGAFYGALV